MAIQLLDHPMPEAARNARIYAGDILVFRRLPAVTRLVETLAARVREHLGADPEGAHATRAPGELHTAADTLRRAVLRDDAVQAALREALAAAGVELAATYGDGLKQRVQPPMAAGEGHLLAPLDAHRDTWGSNIMAQTNWWAPVWPLAPERTLALFPGYFRHPVANISARWDFAELRRRIRAGESTADYPFLPHATDPPSWADALPIVVQPGDLVAFSGAQLHASVPNTTDRTRLSVELRTVNAGDVASGVGAPNVDGAAPRTCYQWFKRLTDGARLGAMTPETGA